MQKIISRKIKVKKKSARGDEVIFLFFGLVFLIFLFISFFRLFAIGKLLDDFLFLFLFGWTKYLVYLLLFISILPVYFNCYFRFKFSFVLLLFAIAFASSWLVANIKLVFDHDHDLWLSNDVYGFNELNNYFHQWWEQTIINNYRGFFATPVSFASWTDVSSFFPNFATGGIAANFLVAISNYGFFITNFIISLIVFFIFLPWMLFARPWLFFVFIFIIFWPIISHFKKKNKISQKQNGSKVETIIQAKQRQKLSKTQKLVKVAAYNPDFKKDAPLTAKTANLSKKVEPSNILRESSNLTPFGSLTKDPTTPLAVDGDDN